MRMVPAFFANVVIAEVIVSLQLFPGHTAVEGGTRARNATEPSCLLLRSAVPILSHGFQGSCGRFATKPIALNNP